MLLFFTYPLSGSVKLLCLTHQQLLHSDKMTISKTHLIKLSFNTTYMNSALQYNTKKPSR
jgi:hypothetical protein